MYLSLDDTTQELFLWNCLYAVCADAGPNTHDTRAIKTSKSYSDIGITVSAVSKDVHNAKQQPPGVKNEANKKMTKTPVLLTATRGCEHIPETLVKMSKLIMLMFRAWYKIFFLSPGSFLYYNNSNQWKLF